MWFSRKILPLLAGFALLGVAVSGTILLVGRQQHAFAAVQHTLVVDNLLSTLLLGLEGAETGERGYLLTGQSEFLEPYNNAVGALDGDFVNLKNAVADNPRQRNRVPLLQTIAKERANLLADTIADYQSGQKIPVARLLKGKELMDQARKIVADMEAEEEALLNARSQHASASTNIVFGGLSISVLLYLFLAIATVRQTQGQLSEIVSTRDSLATANVKLRKEAASREAAEQQLRQMQKMEAIGQLTGGIAHDFNNMLSVILSNLDLAKRRIRNGSTDIGAYVDSAIGGAVRAADLTRRLLAFSRMQPLAPTVININALVQDMTELLRSSIGENIRLESVLSGGLWDTNVDPSQLQNAILNLAVNARDAMPNGGQLTIETSNACLDDEYARAFEEVTAGQYVAVAVTDTGTGMSSEIASRAFDPFFTTKEVGKGTGLGLSQVYGFVKQSGGHIRIYSEPGHGTTVRIYLKRAIGTERREAARSPRAEPRHPSGTAGETILVVEDDDGVREATVRSLRELGYTALHASSGERALQILEERPEIGLLFTDVVMPDMSGRVLADIVEKRWRHVKILYTTGYTQNAIVHSGALDQGVQLLQKPFALDQLARKVRKVLDGGVSA